MGGVAGRMLGGDDTLQKRTFRMDLENSRPWLDGIEGQGAIQLIQSNSPVIRVVAGPGSGKTTCLKRRTQRLVAEDGVDPESIFVGTFTRAIANELQSALGDRVRVSTLHSLAYGLLRKYPAALQGMRLRFLLNYEQDCMLYDLEDVAASIGDLYARRKELLRLEASISQRADYQLAEFAGAVRQWLKRYRSMLIGEVVYLCVAGLDSHDIPPGGFDHVVIDEYQDLTAAEQELIHLVWSKRGSLVVMGDDDQSIYGFRFNNRDGLSTFHHTWKDLGCADLSFSDNRRCGTDILKTANLMMKEAGSKKPPMLSRRGSAGRVHLLQWESLQEEVEGLAKYVMSRSEETFLVLVPRRFIGYRLAEMIGDDAMTTFNEEILEHRVAQERFTLASLLANPEDRVAVRVWLGLYRNTSDPAPRRNANVLAGLLGDTGGHELMRQIASEELELGGTGRGNVKARANTPWELISRDLEPQDIIDLAFDAGRANVETDPEKRRWLIQDLRELHRAASALLESAADVDLTSVLETMRYRIATRASLLPDDEKEPRVRIMTLHSAKGLEAENVIIAGIAQQLMPGSEPDPESIDEQCRLLYVAVTRARDSLIVSWPRRIQFDDLAKNWGNTDGSIRMFDGAKWMITSKSSLLPQGIMGAIPGSTFLEQYG